MVYIDLTLEVEQYIKNKMMRLKRKTLKYRRNRTRSNLKIKIV